MPSKRMVSMAKPRHCGPAPQSSPVASSGPGCRVKPGMTADLLGLPRVLHVLDDVELHVPQLAVLLLHLAQVDVLDDVAGLRVDEHRAPRALENLALHRGQQRVAAALATTLLERFVDDAHAVVTA